MFPFVKWSMYVWVCTRAEQIFGKRWMTGILSFANLLPTTHLSHCRKNSSIRNKVTLTVHAFVCESRNKLAKLPCLKVGHNTLIPASHACHFRTWEVKPGRSRVQGQIQLVTESEASLGYSRLSQKKKNKANIQKDLHSRGILPYICVEGMLQRKAKNKDLLGGPYVCHPFALSYFQMTVHSLFKSKHRSLGLHFWRPLSHVNFNWTNLFCFVMANLGCQLHIPGKREPQLKNCLLQTGLWVCLSGTFLVASWCRQAQTTVGLCCVRKVQEQTPCFLL